MTPSIRTIVVALPLSVLLAACSGEYASESQACGEPCEEASDCIGGEACGFYTFGGMPGQKADLSRVCGGADVDGCKKRASSL